MELPNTSDELQSYLEAVMRVRAMMGPLPEGLVYCGLEEAVLRRGFEFKKRRFDVHPRPMKRCYNNAYELFLHSDEKLYYCEGYAFARFFPTSHAWCCDVDGNVLDPTWTDEAYRDTLYRGIVFADSFVLRKAVQRGHPGVLMDGNELIDEDILRGTFETVDLHTIESKLIGP